MLLRRAGGSELRTQNSAQSLTHFKERLTRLPLPTGRVLRQARRWRYAMIAGMSASRPVSLETRILDLPVNGIARIGAMTARKLAAGVAEISTGTFDEIPQGVRLPS